MGFAIAAAALRAGWAVDLVSGPVIIEPPKDAELHKVVTGEEMFHAVDRLFDRCDVLIMTAAVCDMRPSQCATAKVKKRDLAMTVTFEPVIDILKTVAGRKRRGQFVVGFAAETCDLERYALGKLREKNLDLIAANRVGGSVSAFESDQNTLTLLDQNGVCQTLGPAPKGLVAEGLIEFIRRLRVEQ